MAAVVKWTFTDPVTAASYTFDVNPREGGTPTYEKTMTYTNTAGGEGRVLAYEGRDKPLDAQFSGVILTEDQYDSMLEWFQVRNQIYLTDDLGRVFTIYITRFESKRVRARSHPWKHEYTCSYVIIDWE